MKKIKTTWSSCPQCNIVVSDRFLKRHEKDHNGNRAELSTPTDVSGTPIAENTSMVDSLLLAHRTNSEYGFFADGNLCAVITTSKLDSEPQLPKSLESRIAFFSPGTMRVGKMAIGDAVAVNGKYTYIAWPNTSVPDCFICIRPNNRLSQGQQCLMSGQMCTINRLPDVIPAAKSLKVRLDQRHSGLPSTVAAKDLSIFIKNQLCKRIVTPGCDMVISYFGKPLEIEVVAATTESHLSANSDSLCEDLSNLNVSADGTSQDEKMSLVNSTPTTGRYKGSVSTPRDLPEVELAVTSGRFYQVKELSVVTLDEEPVSDTTSCVELAKQAPVVAGVDDILDALNQLIVEPISKKNMYDKYGVQVPRGALLHGPSGCGKTLIANAIGRSLQGHAAFITLDSTQLWSKQFGETENRLQNIFQQAMDNSPSVVFIDDIDVICPRRERSQSDLEKRVLSSLVTEIDRVAQSVTSYVFILATTSRLEAVDMTLRRPGRIDRELEVPVPSTSNRKKMITAMLERMLHNMTEQDVSEIAADCHGYVGADLQSLCREAGLNAMKGRGSDSINQAHFRQAMSTVQPSAMREIYIDVPKVRWTDIGGLEKLKQSLIQAIIWPLQHAERFKRLGIRPPRGVLMYGPPGCSKTMIAKALATETSLNFISIKGPELFSKWVGESEKAVREIFRKARNAAPSIIFFDEIDAIAVERGRQQGSGGGVGDRVLAQILTELDGVQGLNNVNIVAATNRPDMIDKALMRPGRLDRLVYVPLPDEKTREEIFRLRLKSVPLADDVSFDELVEKTKMYSGAEIVAVCNEAALMAMQQDLEVERIGRGHLTAAIDSINPQTTETMVNYYTDYAAGIKR